LSKSYLMSINKGMVGMRILVVGAGAIGGYFGGRLVEKGTDTDVTFLVRERRKRQLEETGLMIKSIHGNFHKSVQTITVNEKADPFDLIILAIKSYHLDGALQSIQSFVGQKTAILPLLNGISHVEKLKEAYGEERVLGGLCFIESTLNDRGEIEQFSGRHDLVFGELDGANTERVQQIEQMMQGARMNVKTSTNIVNEMWNKYIFISSFSGITSLMRSSIGPILESPYGRETYGRLVVEIVSIAWRQERSLDEELPQKVIEMTKQQKPEMKSSMQRDIEKGLPTEADHLHGALLNTVEKNASFPVLKTVYSALKTYESSL
jgi:2-dehydropantoate 2-reductase